ncbi:MAG: MEKHLA domain-containing protein [Planctomycetota bacterium]|nr:MAG: MEKHLA domain-containing protein [Planctomycetota bacterium]
MSTESQWPHHDHCAHTQVMLNSFRRFVGRDLIERTGDAAEEAKIVFQARFVVVSHGTQDDPILNYGNKTALALWEMDLPTLMSTPSRLTAEPMHRDERAQLMTRAARDGFVDDYRGIRISSSGIRFLIERAIIWNLVDAAEQRVGQAATFADWKPLPL